MKEEPLRIENQDLKEKLRIAMETLDATSYRVFIENMGEAALILSKEGIILYGNRGFFQMVGARSEELLGTSFVDCVSERDRPVFIDSLHKWRERRPELHLLSKDGETKIVILSIFLETWDEAEHFCLLLTDISKFKRAQHLIEASESVSHIFSKASTLESAFNLMIRALNSHFGWEVIVVWGWDRDKKTLSCIGVTQIPGIYVEEFARKTRELGEGNGLLSGLVWSSYRPVWIEDVEAVADFVRRKEAIESGLHGALAFPFYEDSRLSGVIELFRRMPFKEAMDELMLNFITSVGIQVGLYTQRLFSEEPKVLLAGLLAHSLNGIYYVDKQAIVTSWNASAEKIYGWTAQEMIGCSVTKLYPNDRLAEYEMILMNLSLGGPLNACRLRG